MDWVKLLSEVTTADLKEIDDRLNELASEASSLRALSMVFRARLGVEVERLPVKSPAPPKADATPPRIKTSPETRKIIQSYEYRVAVARFLFSNGPAKPEVIRAGCGIPAGDDSVFAHEWFTRTDRGVELTQDGKKAATAAA